MTTICARCLHFIKFGPIWHDQYCGAPAVERKTSRDPVTGEWDYVAVNDLGGAYRTKQAHPYARDINKGNCPYFVASTTPAGSISGTATP